MRSGDTARGAHKTDYRSRVDHIADGNFDRAHVTVKSVDTKAVIEKDGVPRVVEVLGKHDAAALRGVNWSTSFGGHVEAGVRRTTFSVQDAAVTEVVACVHAIQWRAKHSSPKPLICGIRVNVVHMRRLFRGTRAFFWIGIHELVRDFEAFDREVACYHEYSRFTFERGAIWQMARDSKVVFAGGALEVDAEERMMNAVADSPKRQGISRPTPGQIRNGSGAIKSQLEQATLSCQLGVQAQRNSLGAGLRLLCAGDEWTCDEEQESSYMDESFAQ
jgi:hypothetical protein